jgi:hypothetical protein
MSSAFEEKVSIRNICYNWTDYNSPAFQRSTQIWSRRLCLRYYCWPYWSLCWSYFALSKAELRLDIPDPPTFEEAKSAAERYPGFETHPFPTCFGCGHERTEGDGLRIFSGPVNGSDVMAAPWFPDPSLAGETGRVRTEFLWAALDCPAGWAVVNLKNALYAPTSP